MTTAEREHLVVAFVRGSLAMEALAKTLVADRLMHSFGGRLAWQSKQLRFIARDVDRRSLQPSDLVTMLSSARDTIAILRERNCPKLVTDQMLKECATLEIALEACGISAF